ncbi:MAG: DUF3352 domain-containing protein, partial [Demequinaceae bacterium]|nr:DUF3352 domain-containing protein [Demequinaceae bacterium]
MVASEHISHEQAIAAVYDPSTSRDWLAHIATHYYDLHPAISQHPQAYDALRAWMASVAARPAAAATPPAAARVFNPMPVEPVASPQAPALAVDQPAYAAPVTTYPVTTYPGATYPVTTYPVTTYAGADAYPAARRANGKRAAIIAGIAVVTLALAGTGAVAAYQKFMGPDGGIADSASAMPASTFAMIEVSIEPSTQQKLALSKTWSNLDGITALLDESGASSELTQDPGTEMRPPLWNAFIDASGIDTGLDYDKDIAPWLGGRMGIGMTRAADAPESGVVVAIECKDSQKGIDAITRLIEDSGESVGDTVQLSEKNGYIVITSASLDLDVAYADGVLADQKAFTGVVGELGSRGLASVWIGSYAASEALAAWSDGAYSQADLDEALANVDKDAGQATVIRALNNGIEIQSVGTGGARADSLTGNANAGTQIGALPDTTAMAVSIQQLGGLLDAALSQEGALSSLGQYGGLGAFGLGGSGDDPYGVDGGSIQQAMNEARSTIEDALGLSIPEDVNEVFGDGLMLAVDGDLNCEFDISYGPGNCDSPHVAALVAADDAQGVIDTVNGWGDGAAAEILSTSGIEATISDDGHLVSWGMGSYAKDLVDKQSDPLSEQSAFKDAMPDRDKATMA